MTNISKVIESVKSIHGDERAQASKRRDYLAWLARQANK